MARFNPAQVKKIQDQNAGRATSTASPVQKVQTSSMAKPLSPTAQTQSAVLTDKGIVKTPVTNVASNAPTSVPKVTASTPVKPTFVPTRQDKEQYWNNLNNQRQAGQYDAGTQVRMADEAKKKAEAGTGQIKFDTEGLFGGEMPEPATATGEVAAPVTTGEGAPTSGQEGAIATAPVEGEVVGGVPTEGAMPGSADISQAKTPAEAAMMAGGGMTGTANQYLQAGQQMAQENYSMAESARRLDLLSTLNSTNAREMADAMGVKMENMTMAQLEQLATASGLKPDQAVLNRIEQEGAAAIQDIRMERGDVLAENEFTRQQTERIFDRALDDRERFNAAQDVKLKNAMATLGGGSASQGSLVEVMGAQEQGRRAMEDLTAEYGGRMDSIGRQAQSIVREYGAMERQINQQVAGAIEAKYAELQNTIKDLRKQGVTNTKDLNAAMLPLMKEYVGFYNDAVKWQAEQMLDVQKEVNNETERLYRRSFDADKEMAQQTGMVYQNGQPMLDMEGNPVPTISGLKAFSDMDYQQSQMTGVVHKNGQMLLDSEGNAIPTAELYKFEATETRLKDQFDRTLGQQISEFEYEKLKDDIKRTDDWAQFNITTGMQLEEAQYNKLKQEIEFAEKGYDVGVSVNTSQATPSFNPAKSVYGITPTSSGTQVNARYTGDASKGTAVLTTTRKYGRQCGGYVNDAIGIPSYFGDSFAEKKAKVTTQVPSPGSAFVLQINGVSSGHVGLVEEVYPDGTLLISESNAKGDEKFFRGRVSLDSLRNRGLVGFTGGLMTEKKIQKMPGLPGMDGSTGQIGQPALGMTITGKPQTVEQLKDQGYYERMVNAEKVFKELGTSIEGAAANARISPDWNPVTAFGLLKGAFGGGVTGRDFPKWLQGPEVQKQIAAEADFIQAVLRKESQGQITQQEFADYRPKFFPMPGDTPEVIAQKRELREQTIKNMQINAGLSPTGSGVYGDVMNPYKYIQNILKP